VKVLPLTPKGLAHVAFRSAAIVRIAVPGYGSFSSERLNDGLLRQHHVRNDYNRAGFY
jgi:hypothetical protein